MGAWRYTTLADCTRLWHWYANVGAPEPVQTAVACVRAAAILGALALPQITEHTRAGNPPPVTGSAIPASRVVRGSQIGIGPTDWSVASLRAAGESPALYLDIPQWTPATMPGLRTDNAVALSFAPMPPTPVPEPAAWLMLAVPVLLVVGVRL